MSHPVQISDQLLDDARRYAGLNQRSVPKQIEYWARVGKLADENPDLPYGFIREILLSRQEADTGELADYPFG